MFMFFIAQKNLMKGDTEVDLDAIAQVVDKANIFLS
jgi:hypothetical protein